MPYVRTIYRRVENFLIVFNAEQQQNKKILVFFLDEV
jgi:hypothetical protein